MNHKTLQERRGAKTQTTQGPAFGRTDFSRIFIFEPPDIFADFLAGYFLLIYQGPLNGGVSNGGVSRSGLVLPFLSFFVLFCPFGTFPGIFPICSGMVRGFSRFVLFLFLGLLRAPTRNSPERVHDTIWTCPEKSGKHPGLETPRFSFSHFCGKKCPEKSSRRIPGKILQNSCNKNPPTHFCRLPRATNDSRAGRRGASRSGLFVPFCSLFPFWGLSRFFRGFPD